MDIRTPFSRLKKKVKHRLAGNKPNSDKTGADVSGSERLDSTSSPLGPGPDVVADGGRNREENRSNPGQARLTDRPLQPFDEGENDREGGEAGDGGGASTTGSHPLPAVDVVVGTGPSREGNNVDEEKVGQAYHRSPSNLSIPHSGRREGA